MIAIAAREPLGDPRMTLTSLNIIHVAAGYVCMPAGMAPVKLQLSNDDMRIAGRHRHPGTELFSLGLKRCQNTKVNMHRSDMVYPPMPITPKLQPEPVGQRECRLGHY